MARVEVIESFHEFEQLRGAWNDLARRDGPPLPYTRHEWLASWWLGFGDSATLAIHVARDGGALTAAAPFMRSRRTLAGVPVQALHSLGLNLGFADFIRDPERPEDLGAVLRAAHRDPRSDVVLARGTPVGSAKEAWAREWLEREEVSYETLTRGEFYLDGSGGMEGYRAGRPHQLQTAWRKRSRQLAARGEVRFERIRGASVSWERGLADSFDVSLRSWKARSGTAIGQQPSYQRFLTELARRFGSTDEAELCLLRLDGRAIAFRMGVSDGDLFVDHEIAFDEAWGHYGPGNLVALHSDTALIESGIREINLGFDFDWKRAWAPSRRERVEWILYRGGRPMALAARAARSLRGRLLGARRAD